MGAFPAKSTDLSAVVQVDASGQASAAVLVSVVAEEVSDDAVAVPVSVAEAADVADVVCEAATLEDSVILGAARLTVSPPCSGAPLVVVAQPLASSTTATAAAARHRLFITADSFR
jgi:hypothetical protein